MSDLNDQLKALKGRLNAENDLGGQRDMAKIADLEQQIADLQTEARTQEQESKVESITLPYDFNEVFEDPRANEMIVELIREYQRAAYAEHNQELGEMATAHRDEIRAATDRELQLKRQNDALQDRSDELFKQVQKGEDDLFEVENKWNQTRFELEDTASKRDAAVAKAEGLELLVSEKQAQIDKLRDEIAIGAVAAVNVVNIDPSARLARLVEESKQAKVKSALDIALENSAPFRGKVIKDGEVVAPLYAPEVPTFQAVDPSSDTGYTVVTGPAESVPADDQVTFPSEEDVHSGCTVDQGSTGENGQTLAEAFKRIEALEAKLGA